MRTICAWCKKTMADDGIPASHDSHGMCDDCSIDAELALEARLADQQEERWAREALPRAPRSVVETLAEGSLLTVAAKVAREMLR